VGLVALVVVAAFVVVVDRPGDTGAATAGEAPSADLGGRVARVVDGDTVKVRTPAGDETVRLIGIDTPETKAPGRPVECFGPEASARAEELMPPGTAVVLELDPTQDTRDRYGRLLAYVHVDDGSASGPDSVNRELVQSGHAEVYVFRTPFRYAAEFSRAERAARDSGRGLWGRCVAGRAATPGPDAASSVPGADCDPAYVGACVPAPPPDLDCDDLDAGGIRIVGADPHRLDGDGDGVACD